MAQIWKWEKMASDLSVRKNELNQQEWEKLLKAAGVSAFQQAWAYGEALKEYGAEIDRLVIYRNDKPLAMAQMVRRKFFFLYKVGMVMRGPVWLDEGADKSAVIKAISQNYPTSFFNHVIFSPEDDFETGLKQVVTGPGTAILDLTPKEDLLWAGLYSKNRNKVRGARKSPLEITIGDHTHLHTNWLLAKERRQQKSRNYSGLPVKMVPSYARHSLGKNAVVTVFALIDDLPVAGALFLRHGAGATYHIGWSGRAGRKVNALNLILWEGIVKLHDGGAEFLDLGGLNTKDAPGIARFKMGFGAEVKTLPGTFM